MNDLQLASAGDLYLIRLDDLGGISLGMNDSGVGR